MASKLVGALGYGLTIFLVFAAAAFIAAGAHGFYIGDVRNSWQAIMLALGLSLLAFALSAVTYSVLK